MESRKPTSPSEETVNILDKVLRSAIQDLPDVQTQLKCRRRYRFGVAAIVLAPFCLVVGLVPWPTAHEIDRYIWFAFALALLLVGAWQIDKASKDEAKARHLMDDAPPTPRNPEGRRANLRRIQ